ncbi:hypothetical protein HYY75_00315 [bacterium]|nr:hypothetical protein [bacterium]
MKHANLEETIKNMLVYLKGQMPLINAKRTRDEAVFQIQQALNNLRSFATEIELAAASEPQSPSDSKNLSHELEILQHANQRMEGALFQEMDKAQNFSTELESCKQLLQERDGIIEEKKNQILELNSRLGKQSAIEPQSDPARDAQIEEQKHEIFALRELLHEHGEKDAQIEEKTREIEERKNETNDQKRLIEEKKRENLALKTALEKLETQLQSAIKTSTITSAQAIKQEKEEKALEAEINRLTAELKNSEEIICQLKDSLGSLEPLRHSVEEALQTTKKELDDANAEWSRKCGQLTTTVSRQQEDLNESYGKIRLLKETIDNINKEKVAVTEVETLKNTQASMENKVAFLEKNLVESNKALLEARQRGEANRKVIETLRSEKSSLERRILDFEAAIQRTSMRIKSMESESKTQPTHPPVSLPENCVFFFEFFSTVLSRLSDSSLYKDICLKAEEGLKLLGKHYALEMIPTLGHPISEQFHKVVKTFFSNILDDGTIIYEVNKGFHIKGHFTQRAFVWIAKSCFKCGSCNTAARPQDNFCQKCGLELTAPDGTPRQKIPTMPANSDLFLPLVDALIRQGNLQKAEDLIAFICKEHPDHNLCQERIKTVANLKIALKTG